MQEPVAPPDSTSALRVAMVSMSCYPQDPRVRRLAECLERRGIGVDVVCLGQDEQPQRETRGLVSVHRVLPRAAKSSVPAYLKLSARFYRAVVARLALIAAERPFALLHVHNMPDYLVYVGRPFRRRGVPVILDHHDLMSELFASRWKGTPLGTLQGLVDRVHRRSCGHADHLLTTSEGFRQVLLAEGFPDEGITLVMNTADPSIFGDELPAYSTHPGPPRLLYHGTVAERFGVHNLIAAVARLRQELGEVTLQIHGSYEDPYRRRLERQTKELDVGGAVHFGDYLDLEQIRDVIDACDIGVVPYLSDSFMDLALSTKTFEYIARGLPVVTSQLPATSALFGADCIRYVRPNDAADLARGVRETWLDPDRRRQMREAAHAAYRPIAWPVMEARYLKTVGRLTGTEIGA